MSEVLTVETLLKAKKLMEDNDKINYKLKMDMEIWMNQNRNIIKNCSVEEIIKLYYKRRNL